VVIGIVAFLLPGVTIAALVVIFGVYAFIDGVTNLMWGLTRRAAQRRAWCMRYKVWSASPSAC